MPFAKSRNPDGLDPLSPLIALYGDMAYGYAGTGQRDSALAILRRTPCTIGYSCGFEGVTFARLGDRASAMERIRQLEALSKHRYVPADCLAWIYAELGDSDSAITWFSRAVVQRSAAATYAKTAPFFVRVRADPRFVALVKRTGVP